MFQGYGLGGDRLGQAIEKMAGICDKYGRGNGLKGRELVIIQVFSSIYANLCESTS